MFSYTRPDAVHAFHTQLLLGSIIPILIIIQKQLQDHRIHKTNMVVSSSFGARLPISRWFHDDVRLIQPRKPPRLLMDVTDVLRGRRVEFMHLCSERRVQRTRVVLRHGGQYRTGTNNGGSALTSPNVFVTPFCSLNDLA